jgi:CRP/FNR family transcriptional regulator
MGVPNNSGKIASFFETSREYSYRKGETILRAGDIPSGVYYIEKGFVKAYSVMLDGSENLWLIHKPGEVFPGPWIFGYEVGNVTFEAVTPVVIRRKPKDEALALLDSNPDATREALNMAISIIDVLFSRIENLELMNSFSRVIKRLLILSQRFGIKNGLRVTLSVPLTHTHFANSINMSRETASRELEQLKQKNIITEKNHIITIEDIEKLENELTDYFENR